MKTRVADITRVARRMEPTSLDGVIAKLRVFEQGFRCHKSRSFLSERVVFILSHLSDV